jgi:N-acetylmuramic acid 6-phosphate etherase
MTGGDYALVQSVESFEDYPQFGRRQARDLGINTKDTLVAISEGGETFSVLGSVMEAVEAGARVFLMFNNPADLLREHIARSKEVIEHPAVTVLDLYCGPMAIAGSTRMQATSSEQLIAGAMLEKLLDRILRENLSGDEKALFPESDIDYAAEMKRTIADLQDRKSLEAIAEHIEFEEKVYKAKGLITYFVDDFLIDVFTDTTERSPTFMLPQFRKYDDLEKPPPWAFVKTPSHSTPQAWLHHLGRQPRCLEWTIQDYKEMKAPASIIENPPAIGVDEMLKFLIGNEDEPYRHETPNSSAVIILTEREFNAKRKTECLGEQKEFKSNKTLILGNFDAPSKNSFLIPGKITETNLRLMEHMKIKLVLNTISTGTMARLGKITSNWMSHVSVSNKKLLDRSIRMVAELAEAETDYETACLAVHQSILEIKKMDTGLTPPPSPVQYTLRKLQAESHSCP